MISKKPFAVKGRALSLDTFWFAGFEVLTAVLMKSSTFHEITTCSPVKGNG
jgi:hypothetical protein